MIIQRSQKPVGQFFFNTMLKERLPVKVQQGKYTRMFTVAVIITKIQKLIPPTS